MLEKINDFSSKEKLSIICGLVVLVALIFVLSTGFEGSLPDNVYTIDNEEINQLFFDLGDNYVITINETTSDNSYEHIYYYDGRLKLYESDTSEYGFLEYNDKMYKMNAETKELTLYEDSVSFLNNSYYDFDLIKKMTELCDYEYLSSNSVSCNVSLDNYSKLYNEKYGIEYDGVSDFITITITYGEKISYMSIDYGDIDVSFTFKYHNSNYEIIYDNYKDILEG